jgi:predicted MarR family transcription regulator
MQRMMAHLLTMHNHETSTVSYVLKKLEPTQLLEDEKKLVEVT